MSLISRKLLTPRIQELGKIKLGGKGETRKNAAGKEWQMPVKFDHFVVTTRERGPDGNFIKDEGIHAHPNVGEEPTELDAVLMFETPAENFHSEMVVYKGRTKVFSCDGENATNLTSGEEKPCVMAAGGECSCKPYSRLHLQLMASPTLEGYHVFRTTSWESTNNIQTALERFYFHFGTLLGLPVQLVCYPATVTYDQGDKTHTSKAYMAGLVLAMSFEEVSQKLIKRAEVQQLTRTEVKRLAAQVESSLTEADREDEAHIAAEFFPDEAGASSAETQATLDSMKAELGVGEQEEDDAEEADYEIVEEGPDEPTPEQRAQAAEPEPEPDPEQDGEPQPASASQLVELMKLREKARGTGDGLSLEDEEALEAALQAKEADTVAAWIETLQRMVAEGDPEQPDLLAQGVGS